MMSSIVRSTVPFGRAKCDRSVVSDLKTSCANDVLFLAAAERLRYSLDIR